MFLFRLDTLRPRPGPEHLPPNRGNKVADVGRRHHQS
jgi:hypothetical protein